MSMLTSEVFQGLACQRLTLPCGDTVLVALQGAHVLSWVSQGRERLFLSPNNLWDGQSAIRGGVPVCFPQFNQRGKLPKHGFARNMLWHVEEVAQIGEAEQENEAAVGHEGSHMVFTLQTNTATLAIWPQAFVAQLRVALAPGQLTITLTVNNTELQNDLHFIGALHTYLAVDDIDLTELRGLGGSAEWDSTVDVHGVADDVLYFDGEFDRVYSRGEGATIQPLHLQDGTATLQIEQSPSWAESVVWNPGEGKCAALADMPAQGFARMLCVEAAQVFEPISIPAGGQWVGWQRLTVS
ncbi:D-hexose-6-phosphate mutarotase [Limnohabitans sp. B9-3]|uniref:D-hexose-6-phosphate mutarotase n=1 Tax=Limnohabitans sp. B9-3 TaxID=1100707 RepID=UPI001E293C81|nr:D-hexose-6-phosphate mutarotase [Limnohabitans sp. B9-3]